VVGRGEAGGGAQDGDALLGAVGATGEVGDGELGGWCADDGARRGHAVHEAEYFKFGFELVGNAIDGEVGVTQSVFNGGDEGDEREGGRAETLAKFFLGVA